MKGSPFSDLRQETGCRDSGLSQFPLVIRGRYRDSSRLEHDFTLRHLPITLPLTRVV